MRELNKVLSKQKIEQEIKNIKSKPPSYATSKGYPYNDLEDREFEILAYYIFGEDIKCGKLGAIDKIVLMQSVGERGRDCILYNENQVAGLVQCKKYKERIDKNTVIKEIIKFLLYSIKEPEIMGNPTNFVYYIVASRDFTGSATELLARFKNKILLEPIDILTMNVINSYVSFQDLEYDCIAQKLRALLTAIEVKKLVATDLDLKLNEYHHLVDMFFSVEKVISVENNEKMMQQLLESIKPQGIIEQLHSSFKRKDFIDATDKIDSIKRMLSTNDGYSIIPDLDKPGLFKVTGALKIKSEVVLPNNVSSVDDLMRKANNNQETIQLKAKAVEVKAGNELIKKFETNIEDDEQTILMELYASEAEIMVSKLIGDERVINQENILTIIPQPFAKPRQILLETGGFIGTSINLLLRLEKIEELVETNRMILSSFNSKETPIIFRLSMEVPKIITADDKGNARVICNDFELYLSDDATTYHKVLIYNFLNEMKQNDNLVVRDCETGKEIYIAKGVKYNSKLDVSTLKELWEAIYKIETVFNIQLEVPDEVSLQELEELNEVKIIIEKGKINNIDNCQWTFLLNVEQDRVDLERQIKSWSEPFAYSQDCSFSIYDRTIDLGKRIIFFKFSKKDLQNLIDTISKSTIGKNFELNMTAGVLLCIFPKFYGTEDWAVISKREKITFIDNKSNNEGTNND